MYFNVVITTVAFACILWLVYINTRHLSIYMRYGRDAKGYVNGNLMTYAKDGMIYAKVNMDVCNTGNYVIYDNTKLIYAVSADHRLLIHITRLMLDRHLRPKFDGWEIYAPDNGVMLMSTTPGNIEKKIRTMERDLVKMFSITIKLNHLIDEANADMSDFESAVKFMSGRYSHFTTTDPTVTKAP